MNVSSFLHHQKSLILRQIQAFLGQCHHPGLKFLHQVICGGEYGLQVHQVPEDLRSCLKHQTPSTQSIIRSLNNHKSLETEEYYSLHWSVVDDTEVYISFLQLECSNMSASSRSILQKYSTISSSKLTAISFGLRLPAGFPGAGVCSKAFVPTSDFAF